MTDPRMLKLVRQILTYSLNLKKGENFLIDIRNPKSDIINLFLDECSAMGINAFVKMTEPSIQKHIINTYSISQWELLAQCDINLIKNMNAYLSIDAMDNIYQFSDINQERYQQYFKYYHKQVHKLIDYPKIRWCVIKYPNTAFAQSSCMSLESFQDYYYKVCTMDYSAFSKAMDPLVDRMKNTNMVSIKSKDTNISFSIKGMPVLKCDGKLNVPDGEVYTAPIKTSINGYIHYNTPSIYLGKEFSDVRFEFSNGKIIKASANDTHALNKILDSDEGARYIGEFAIGLNPFIDKVMKNILFDEKIKGSFHLTPGNAYNNCDNGNKSTIHWDLIQIQTPEHGGGEIYFDNELIRKDGVFIPEYLKCLNPENLN